MVIYKICRKCGHSKPASEFYAHRTNADRLDWTCKNCRCDQIAEQRRQSPLKRQKDNARKRAYYHATRGAK